MNISLKSLIHNCFKKFATVGIIYSVGYLNWSFGWLMTPIIYSLVHDYWRSISNSKRQLAQNCALTNEKDVILASLNDLPSWVFFPDIERAEWLNNVIKQCWPYVNHYVKNLLKDSIEPNIQTSLSHYKLSGFKFERIILGSIPPRIGGIKVYEKNVSRKEIVMDIDLFYAGDCDITFTIGAMKSGIKDFQLHGLVRVVMRPLITQIPIVGGLQVYFLNNPTIDFNLVGLADVFDMPGLSDILRKIIMEQVAAMMVLPNKYVMKLNENVEITNVLVTEPEGVLRVHVIEAKNLVKKDFGVLGRGKSDPYAVICVGAQEYRTETISNTLNPKWDYWCEFIVTESSGQRLEINVWDYDEMPKDDETLGLASFDISSVAKYGELDKWITLEQIKHGMIHLRLTWLEFSTDLSDLKLALRETKLLQVTNMNSSLLIIFVDSAKNLPKARASSSPDPFVKISVGKNRTQTPIQMRTSDPVYEKGFHFLINDPQSDILHFSVVDNKTEQEIGALTYNLTKLLEHRDFELSKQPFQLLRSGPESKLILTMALKILKCRTPDETVAHLIRKDSTLSDDSAISSNSSPMSKNSTLMKVNSEILEESEPEPELGSHSKSHVSEVVQNLKSESLEDSESTIHRRSNIESLSAGEYGLGRIQLTLRYSKQRQKLIVTIHKIVNLPVRDKSSIPDPYVKLYLLPERLKESKRKTQAFKDNCNPVYDESFEYTVSPGEINSGCLVEVTVVTQKKLFYSNSNILGQAIVDLQTIDLNTGTTTWFDLTPEQS